MPCGVALFLSMLAATALAPEAHAESGGVSAGLGVARSSPAYRAYDNDTRPFPFVSWEGERFYFHGVEAGYRVLDGSHNTLSVTATPLALRFRSGDTRNAQMKHLHDRRMLAAAGAEWKLHGEFGNLSARLQAEFTGVGGYVGDLSYSYPILLPRLVIAPEIGVKHESKEITRHYYGVSRSEAQRSGLAGYRPEDANSPYAGVAVIVPINARWSATAMFRRMRLADSIKDSPMVGSRQLDTSLLTISRTFR